MLDAVEKRDKIHSNQQIKKKREAEDYNDIIKTTVMLWKGVIWDGWREKVRT